MLKQAPSPYLILLLKRRLERQVEAAVPRVPETVNLIQTAPQPCRTLVSETEGRALPLPPFTGSQRRLEFMVVQTCSV